MLSDIITALRLNNESTGQKFLFVTKDSISDLNFIFSEILSFYVKNNYCIILLNLAQSSNHYNHLLLKSGVNMRQLRDQHNIIVIDVLSEIEKLTDSGTNSSSQGLVFAPLITDCHEAECLKQLYNLIRKSVENLISEDETKKFVIFFDEINILLNLGISLKSVELLIQYCRSLCFSNTASANILFVGSMHEEQDTENSKLANFLLHLADIKIQVEGLKTGYSKDAHGKIMLTLENKSENTSSHQKLLFKVTEKGAKLLTLGL